MTNQQNMDKLTGLIFDILGIMLWVLTLVLLYQGKIVFIWDGLAMLITGTVFFAVGESFIVNTLKRIVDVVIHVKSNGANPKS
jgi:hypothetical protein